MRFLLVAALAVLVAVAVATTSALATPTSAGKLTVVPADSARLAANSLVINEVVRTIDVSTAVQRGKMTLEVANTGSGATDYVLLTVPPTAPAAAPRQAVAEVTVRDASGAALALEVAATATAVGNSSAAVVVVVRANLRQPLGAGESARLTATVVVLHALAAYPAEIGQREDQLMRVAFPAYVAVPYAVKTQRTEVQLASATIESKSEVRPVSAAGSTVTYGPYADVAPWTWQAAHVHFVHNRPFLTAQLLTREYEVSHWGGNLAVEDTYDALVHDGARLKGGWSRHDYQMNPTQLGASVRKVRLVLPPGAADLYYRDDIGNISTSNVWPLADGSAVHFDVQPRFPMFGGWKTIFYMGWNLPLARFLRVDAADSSLHVLNVSLLETFEHVVVDDAIVRIVLPETATDIALRLPFAVDSQQLLRRHTFLDLPGGDGRPVIELRKRNLAFPEHHQHFQVVYRLASSSLLREPGMVVAFVFLLLLAFSLLSRIDLAIAAPKSKRD